MASRIRSILVACLPVLLLGAIAVVVDLSIPEPPSRHNHLFCMNNLRQIHGLLETARIEGRPPLRPLPGAAFLLQIEAHVLDEDLKVFCCPLDKDAPRPIPRTALRCSYFGPDLETAEALVAGREMPDRFIACCDRHGNRGLLVVGPGPRVREMRWSEFSGSTGGPVPIGPDSPDPRLRHLVR